MNDLISKLLNLKNYTYHLWGYRLSHSLLTLRGVRGDKQHHNVHLIFANLLYLQMPTSWTGDLFVASNADFIDILRQTNIDLPNNEKSLEMLKETYSLYKAVTSKTIIYVLGTLHAIEYDVEPIYN